MGSSSREASLKAMFPEVDEEVLEFMSDIDEEEAKYVEEPFEEDMGSVVVVDNLPKIPVAKYEKLMGVLKRIFNQTGKIVRAEMPMEKEQTLGVAFVELSTPEEASRAVKLTDGYQLDKSHVFKVNPYSDLPKLAALPETWEPAPKPEFAPRLNPHGWLGDDKHRDQLAVRYNNETEIVWAEKGGSPTLEYGGEREKQGGLYWCELYVQWSPRGSLLATFHNKGVALWGGVGFTKQGRFAHQGVKQICFSPAETYLATYNDRPDDKRGVVIWDVRNRREIRVFETSQLASHVPPQLAAGATFKAPLLGLGENDPQYQVGVLSAAAASGDRTGPQPGAKEFARFGFSSGDKYCARRAAAKGGGYVISVYELPGMTLLDKKSLKADGVVDFEWSPSDNVLAYWAPEIGNAPARVVLVEIPSRKELRQRNLVNLSSARLYWHPDGEYLCVKVIRHTKSKKTTFSALELFRVKEPLVPVEMLELKDPILAFAWEPQGHRFGVVHVPENAARPDVTFYSMLSVDGKKKEIVKVHTLKSRPCNALFWSPMGGGHVVCAGLGDGMDGALEFVDLDNKWSKSVEHYRCTHVAWDPSGRVVATSVVQPLEGAFFKFQMDNGYKLWTFQGQHFYDASFENMYQLTWRPRPKSLLDDAQKKHVVKNLRKYERRFAHEDKLQELARQRELSKEKRAQRAAYRKLLKLRTQTFLDNKKHRIAMRNGVDADHDDHYIVTKSSIESVLSSKEEPC